MAEVIDFKTKEKVIGIDENYVDPDKVLDCAKGLLDSVILIGVCNNGDKYFAASMSSKAKIIMMIEQFKMDIMLGRYDDDDESYDDQ